MIDASDKRLLAWLAKLPPRQELMVRMALNGRSKNQGRDWDVRVSALMRELNVDTTGKMTKLLREVRKQGKVIEPWVSPSLFTFPPDRREDTGKVSQAGSRTAKKTDSNARAREKKSGQTA
jgi:hypothetical protein